MTALRKAATRTFSSLSTPNLRLYFAGGFVSQVGSWIQLMALPWLVLHLTHSGVLLGATYTLQFLPVLVLGAWAGVVADRHDKRVILLITTTGLGVVALVLGALTLLDLIAMWNIVIIALLLGVFAAFDGPTRRAFVPELVQPDEISNAISLSNAVLMSARIIGPSIAGILIATVGIGWCFMVNAASFTAVIVVLLMLQTDQIRAAPPIARARGQLRAGVTYAWNEPIIRLAIIMTFVIGVLAFNFQVVLPLLAKRTFHEGPSAYAVMSALVGFGALIGALFSAHRARASARTMCTAAIAFGVTMAAATLAPTLTFEYIVLVPIGACSMAFFSMAAAAVQEGADGAILGRVTALFSVAFMGSTPIGSPLLGAITQAFGARAALGVGAISAVVVGAVGLIAVYQWVRPSRARVQMARATPA